MMEVRARVTRWCRTSFGLTSSFVWRCELRRAAAPCDLLLAFAGDPKRSKAFTAINVFWMETPNSLFILCFHIYPVELRNAHLDGGEKASSHQAWVGHPEDFLGEHLCEVAAGQKNKCAAQLPACLSACV